MKKLGHQDHFQAVRNSLAPHENIWNHEVLHLNWQLGKVYPERWLEGILKLSEEEAFLFDTGKQMPPIDAELDQLLAQLKNLSRFPKLDSPLPSIDPKIFLHIKEKKVHEISNLMATITHAFQAKVPLSLVDIGGGVGHFARAISTHLGCKVVSIDGNAELQSAGKIKLARPIKGQRSANVSFHHALLGPTQQAAETLAHFEQCPLSVGLHTCGNLALAHFNYFLKARQSQLVNIGCCYNKLDAQNDVHLSQFARLQALPFNQYALSLATRGYAKLTLKDYQLKKRVKLYRYGLHFLLESEYAQQFPTPVGECNTKIYWRPFSEYAKMKIEQAGLAPKLSDSALNQFLEQKNIQAQIELMISADLIRWQFGRSIEAYILLDRALMLEESNQEVSLFEVFDETISPRNIALIVCDQMV